MPKGRMAAFFLAAAASLTAIEREWDLRECFVLCNG